MPRLDHRPLERTAEHGPAGITWWTDPAWLPPEDRARYPRGYHDLSVAHGVPAVAALLARTAARGIQPERGRWLCEGAVGWLQAQEAGYPSGLPYMVEPDRFGRDGAGAAIATRVVSGRPGRGGRADGDGIRGGPARLGRLGAWRWRGGPPDAARLSAGVSDAGFCHGAAGVGHLFNRLYQAIGDATLGDAARFWFDQTLALRQPGHGIAGFATRYPEADGSVRWDRSARIDRRGERDRAGPARGRVPAGTIDWDGILLLSNPERDAPL